MARPPPRETPTGRSSELAELGHRTVPILYRGRPESAIPVRFGGTAYACLNRCVHMPRTLDGETGRIFDDSARQLRCSMHGIAYQPAPRCMSSKLSNPTRTQRSAIEDLLRAMN